MADERKSLENNLNDACDEFSRQAPHGKRFSASILRSRCYRTCACRETCATDAYGVATPLSTLRTQGPSPIKLR
jgi:hypothetical protein